MIAAGARRHLGYAAGMVAVGVAAGAFGIAFRGGLAWVFRRVFGQGDVLSAFEALAPAWRVAVPAIGGVVASAVGILATRVAGGHGVAEILEAVVLGRGRISLATTLWKALASFFAIVSGGSIGREGPLLQVGAAAGTVIAERLALTPRRVRALVAAGTAAGFASAYNTPIAAVLFVIEIVTGIVSLEVVLPIVVATTISTWLTRLALGAGPLYGLRTFTMSSGRELVGYAIVGVATGVVGATFMSLLARGAVAFRGLRAPLARGAAGGLVVGVIALRLPHVAGNGYEAIQQMLDVRFAAPMLVILLLAKAIATTASVSSGSPGGVFTPSLFLGAATGGLVGAAVSILLPEHGFPGGYVLVGMAGAIAATTHAPIMASVLGFELAGDYGIVLPLFIATVLATLISRRLKPGSIYTEELRRRGIPWESTLEQRIASVVRARDIMELDPPTIDREAPIGDAVAALLRTRARVLFVTGGASIGAIDLRRAAELRVDEAQAARHAGQPCGTLAMSVPVAMLDDSLLTLSEKLFEVDWGEVPVADAAHPNVPLGVVSRRLLLATFDRELFQRDQLHTRVTWFDGQTETADFIELPRGHRVEVIAAPRSTVGRPVDVTGLRAGSHVTVLGVRPAAGPSRTQWLEPESVGPTGDGDRWMVVGPAPAIEALRKL
jgi:CIC family chloride channel protein